MFLYDTLNIRGESHAWNANDCGTCPYTCSVMLVYYDVFGNGRQIINIPNAWLSAHIQRRALARLILRIQDSGTTNQIHGLGNGILVCLYLCVCVRTCVYRENWVVYAHETTTNRLSPVPKWVASLHPESEITCGHRSFSVRFSRIATCKAMMARQFDVLWLPRANFEQS